MCAFKHSNSSTRGVSMEITLNELWAVSYWKLFKIMTYFRQFMPWSNYLVLVLWSTIPCSWRIVCQYLEHCSSCITAVLKWTTRQFYSIIQLTHFSNIIFKNKKSISKIHEKDWRDCSGTIGSQHVDTGSTHCSYRETECLPQDSHWAYNSQLPTTTVSGNLRSPGLHRHLHSRAHSLPHTHH